MLSSTDQPGVDDALALEPLPPPENKRFYPALNGLRAVAVLMVFTQHYIDLEHRHPAWHWGWTGVSVFFVLSGFLITGILYDTRHAVNAFRNFYARRFLRIFPLYYGVLLFALLLYPLFRWKLNLSAILLPLYLANFSRFLLLSQWPSSRGAIDALISTWPHFGSFSLLTAHFWSLCVEEQFYLVWPLVVILIKDRITLRRICVAGVLGILALRVAAVLLLPQRFLDAEILYRCSPFCMDGLLLGGLLALMLRGPEFALIERYLKPAFLGFLVAFVVFQSVYAVTTGHVYSSSFPGISGAGLSTVGFTLINLFSALVILLALKPHTLLYRFLCLAPLRALGEISYGFYVFHDLFHFDILSIVRHLLHAGPRWENNLTALIAFFLTLGLSYVSFRFFEAPILRLKARF